MEGVHEPVEGVHDPAEGVHDPVEGADAVEGVVDALAMALLLALSFEHGRRGDPSDLIHRRMLVKMVTHVEKVIAAASAARVDFTTL